jgi:GNAT superfamily N-acetyltransferase
VTGSAVDVVAVAWDDPDAVRLRDAQRVEIEGRYGGDTEPGPKPSADDIALFVVARRDGEALGCGGLRAIDAHQGEVKRMYVAPAARGTGVSTAILRALEAAARMRGWTRLLLETGTRQPDAMRFYSREGYTPIPNYGHYADSPESRCFAKELTPGA